MAGIDVLIQQFFMDYVLLVVYAGIFVYAIKSLFPKIITWIIQQQLYESERCYAITTRFQRQELFVPLHELVSSDLMLRNQGVIRIVDIGVMTGINVKYYPNSTHVVAVDTKYNLEYFFKPLIKRFAHVHIKECVEYDCETLEKIPNDYADAVVGSLVLCKAKDEGTLLNEIHRILAPGGHYYFFEHCVEPEDCTLQRWQTILSVIGLWPNLFYGCHLDRDTEAAVLKSPFSQVKLAVKKYSFEHPFALKYTRTHVMGVAFK